MNSSKETLSFFRGFISAQDEVPLKFSYHPENANDPKSTGLPGNKIIQSNVDASNQLRVSIFKPHSLEARAYDQKPRNDVHFEWVLAVMVICMFLAAMVRVVHYHRLVQIFKAFLKPSYLNQLLREGNIVNERVTPPLILQQLLGISLFVYISLYLLTNISIVRQQNPLVFLILFLVVCAFYGLKALLIRIIGWIFQTREQTHLYIINSIIINEICGLMLLPCSVIMYYAIPDIAIVMAWIAISLYIIGYTYVLIRGFLIGITVRNFSGLYLILYLCTVEILPILIIGKLATGHYLS